MTSDEKCNDAFDGSEKMHALIDFLSKLDPFGKGEDEFLSSLFRELMALIPEADCGSAFVYKNKKVRFVDAVCHDFEKLKKMDLDEKEFKLPRNEVLLLKNTLNYHSEETKKKFFDAIKPLKESIVFDLEIEGRNVAGIGIDILKGKRKSFKKESIMIAKLFKTLATNAFKIKLLQEELAKSKEKFKLVSEFSPIGIGMIGMDFKFIYVNQTACDLTEYSKEELLRMNFWEVVHPKFIKKVKERAIKRLQGAEAIRNYDIKIVTKSGKERWVDLRSQRTFLFDQPVLVVSAIDINALKKAQERKKAITKRYELALEASQNSVFDYDVKSEFIEISEGIFSQLGFEGKKFYGTLQGFKNMIHPNDKERVFLELYNHLTGKKPKVHAEFRMMSKDGGWKWILGIGKIIEKDKKGNPQKIFGIMSNIDDQKRTKEKLREYATYDELTGIYNRRIGLAILDEKMKSSKRNKEPLSICFVDINNLKDINDTFGHAAGDETIQTSVRLIKQNIRKSDVLCRLGGDEFLIIFPSCTLENSEKNWKNVQHAIFYENKSRKRPYKIMLSHGCAQYDYKCSQDEFIAISDKRMYEEKKRMKSSLKRSDLFS